MYTVYSEWRQPVFTPLFFSPHSGNTSVYEQTPDSIGDPRAMTRSTPAQHLNTKDDYVLDMALLNDSLAVRQAGITVQKHRNAQHRNQRNMNDSTSGDQYG